MAKTEKNRRYRQKQCSKKYDLDDEDMRMIQSTDDPKIKSAIRASKLRDLDNAHFRPNMRIMISKYFEMKQELENLKKESGNVDENPAVEEMQELMETDDVEKKALQEANEAMKKKLESQEKELNDMRASMAVKTDEGEELKREVEKLRGELDKLPNVCGKCAETRAQLAAWDPSFHDNKLKTAFVKMTEEIRVVLDVPREEEPACVYTAAVQYVVKHKQILSLVDQLKKMLEKKHNDFKGSLDQLANALSLLSKDLEVLMDKPAEKEPPSDQALRLRENHSEIILYVKQLKMKVENLNGSLARSQADLGIERCERQILLQSIQSINQWLKNGEKGTDHEERVRWSQLEMIPELKDLLLYTGYNPDSEWERPRQLENN